MSKSTAQNRVQGRSYGPPVVVDLFCGIGGLTYGLRHRGFEVVAGFDIDATCAYAYRANNPDTEFIQGDVSKLTPEDISKWYPEGSLRVLVGCAPCQPYSGHASKNVKATLPEEKREATLEARRAQWALLSKFAELILAVQPDVVSMENVIRLANRKKNPIYGEFIDALRNGGYEVSEYKVKGVQYGIPQTRNRLVVLASKIGKIQLIPPTHAEDQYVTVAQTIKDLPEVSAGGTDRSDPIHTACQLDQINLDRIQISLPGTTWREWPPHLQLACHKKASGKTYQNVYGRMEWDKPAPTMTTQFIKYGTGRFGHPVQNRALTLREGALLQTFPINYEFVKEGETISFQALSRHIGNAVPPRLGEVIAESIEKFLEASANVQEPLPL
jgi:DNA (cytosine-5)-methyltransferase 1